VNKTILLTGATGFLGGHLARFLLAMGHRVVALTKSGRKTDLLESVFDEITWYTYDQGIEKPFLQHRFDAVVHTAGIYGRKGESAAYLVDVNVRLGLDLLQATLKAGVPKFINTGTSLPQVTSDYALSKAQFVEWMQRLAGKAEMSLINIRLEQMYGYFDDESKFVTWLVRNLLKNAPHLKLTSGEQKRDFIYIDDVVTAFNAIFDGDFDKGFHELDVGSGKDVSVREVVKMAKELCVSNTDLRFGEIPTRENEPDCLKADISTLSRLGWVCQNSLEEGLIKTINWEKQCQPI